MPPSKPEFKRLARSIVGLVTSVAAIGLSLQVLRLLLETLSPGVERAESGLPLLWQWQLASLGSGFVAGVVGAAVLTAIVTWRIEAHLTIWVLIGVVVDGLAISQTSPPVWFSVVMIAGIPFQALLGYLVARRLFGPA